MKKIIIAIILFMVFGVSNVIFAEDSKKEKKFGNETELAYVQTGGNTEVTTAAAKNLLTYKFTDKLSSEWELRALYGESDGEKNSERYYTHLRANYLLNKRFYTSLIVGGEWDKFAGIDSMYYVGPVAGYKIFIGPKNFWHIEAGLDYVEETYTNNDEEDFIRGRVFTEYEYAFTDKNKFSQSVEYLPNLEASNEYTIISETSLISALSDVLALKTTYKVKYNNMPVPDTLDETDTTLTVALVINF